MSGIYLGTHDFTGATVTGFSLIIRKILLMWLQTDNKTF
jgi:hypothetical protein